MAHEKLKKIRKRLGLSQTEIADELNMTQATFSKYERGITKMSNDFIVKMNEKFKINPSELSPNVLQDANLEESNNNQENMIEKSNAIYTMPKELVDTFINHLNVSNTLMAEMLKKMGN